MRKFIVCTQNTGVAPLARATPESRLVRGDRPLAGPGDAVEAATRRAASTASTAPKKRARGASGRPAERPPAPERRDRPVRHAAQGLLERPRDAEQLGVIKAVEQHATWNHGPREDHGRRQSD